jgi:hypothetical protein
MDNNKLNPLKLEFLKKMFLISKEPKIKKNLTLKIQSTLSFNKKKPSLTPLTPSIPDTMSLLVLKISTNQLTISKSILLSFKNSSKIKLILLV